MGTIKINRTKKDNGLLVYVGRIKGLNSADKKINERMKGDEIGREIRDKEMEE